jgi:hypothetical protein
MAPKKPGLYANINAKRKRIEEGAKERKARPGEADYPDKGAFKAAAKTAKKRKPKK